MSKHHPDFALYAGKALDDAQAAQERPADQRRHEDSRVLHAAQAALAAVETGE